MPRYIRFIFLVPAIMAGLALPERTAAVEIHSKVKIREDMSITQAIVLGVIEGVTEYLPVSSTGHLLVAQRMMGIGNAGSASSKQDEHTKEAADAYAICIQAGAILAVLGLYFRRVRQMIMGALGKDETGLRMFVNIVAAFIPAAVIGVLFSKVIKVHLFGIWPVVLAWFAGGLAILAVDHWRQNNPNQATGRGLPLDQLRGRMALVIGFIQCIAMWPGVSRSLVTIVGGLVVGLSLPAAVEFSFLLGLVTLTA
ncbi:MAG: undecaprenyl-diphosphate phosphatase, partial [Deltaproteobacteria bacterium]|nr:undecaprenyl-diphosphate phosphatase [Deltaproteobacteria bacterium]